MARTTFVAVAPDGKEFTRQTETMAYTHAVLVGHPAESAVAWDGPWSWHLTEAAARRGKSAASAFYSRVAVVPVTVKHVAKPRRKAEATN